MKRVSIIKILVFLLILTIIFTGCSDKNVSQTSTQKKNSVSSGDNENSQETGAKDSSKSQAVILKPYDSVRNIFGPDSKGIVLEKNQYKPGDIYTYSFDNTTVFKENESLASEILEKGKNPGLGIGGLHKRGITGKGVNVAIIDQNMLTDHPEFEGRIVAYYDSGCNEPENTGSYHGASVTGILGGKTVGVAPEVNIYYAAAPSWERDAKYFADCLNWIIKQNKELPKSEKIRVVSVSSAPTSEDNWYKNGEQWDKAVKAAQEEGIMVIDCRTHENTDFIFSSYYDLADQDNVTKCIAGYPDDKDDFTDEYYKDILFVPASFRTLAQEFIKGDYAYRYEGKGGKSWAVPYVSGVLALGWQINPELDGETMKDLLFQSSWVNEEGLHFINPPAFIEAVRKSQGNS